MYQMFVTRHALHRRAYQHKTTQAVEIMSVCNGVGGWQDIASTYDSMRVWVDGKIDHASIKERVRVGSKDDIAVSYTHLRAHETG